MGLDSSHSADSLLGAAIALGSALVGAATITAGGLVVGCRGLQHGEKATNKKTGKFKHVKDAGVLRYVYCVLQLLNMHCLQAAIARRVPLPALTCAREAKPPLSTLPVPEALASAL